MQFKQFVPAGFALSLALCHAVPAQAGIASVAATLGSIVNNGVNGPANSAIPGGAGQNNTTVFVWSEKIAALTSVLNPNIGANIAAGTVVKSHLVRFDPVTVGVVSGTIVFDSPILGILTTRNRLDSTDYLGSPGTTYPTSPSNAFRGIEVGDLITVANSTTINYFFTGAAPGDQIRVLTAVPEPGSVALMVGMGVTMGAVTFRRRRRAA